ncbi:MAG TPA: uracil-DNA glycosylase [Anaerolineales bacterium]|nr:uracil-DNA glycosylase [Anaerolineales bacterium]
MSAEKTLARIAREVAVCTKCALHESRKKAVAGEGPADAEIMFIGEGPGFHENEQGRPFVGAAGRFLDQLLAQAGVTREDVFIANVVKCRPPGNRDPQPEELDACGKYLEAQMNAINPSIIVTLGRFSMGRFIPGVKISEVHGQMKKIGERFVIPMFHPAAALHQPALKPSILADFANLPDQLNEARKALGRKIIERKPVPPKPEKPQQLSLF